MRSKGFDSHPFHKKESGNECKRRWRRERWPFSKGSMMPRKSVRHKKCRPPKSALLSSRRHPVFSIDSPIRIDRQMNTICNEIHRRDRPWVVWQAIPPSPDRCARVLSKSKGGRSQSKAHLIIARYLDDALDRLPGSFSPAGIPFEPANTASRKGVSYTPRLLMDTL